MNYQYPVLHISILTTVVSQIFPHTGEIETKTTPNGDNAVYLIAFVYEQLRYFLVRILNPPTIGYRCFSLAKHNSFFHPCACLVQRLFKNRYAARHRDAARCIQINRIIKYGIKQ